eukprot:GHVR01184475.1.p1 GENE.GHVR01184475.1~~GHVR01184475.1.p1  ORF type:complete len:230 (-),score=63.67 GHVR01184475.1:145-834(-)
MMFLHGGHQAPVCDIRWMPLSPIKNANTFMSESPREGGGENGPFGSKCVKARESGNPMWPMLVTSDITPREMETLVQETAPHLSEFNFKTLKKLAIEEKERWRGVNIKTNSGVNTETNSGVNTETNSGVNTETNIDVNIETNIGVNIETNGETMKDTSTIQQQGCNNIGNTSIYGKCDWSSNYCCASVSVDGVLMVWAPSHELLMSHKDDDVHLDWTTDYTKKILKGIR